MGQKKKRVEGYNFGNASSISGTGGGGTTAGSTSLALEQDIVTNQDSEGKKIAANLSSKQRLGYASKGILHKYIADKKTPSKPPIKPPEKPPVKKKKK